MGVKSWQPRAPRVLFSFFVLTVLLYVSDIHHSESIRAARESASEAQPQHRTSLAAHTIPNAGLSAAPQSASDTRLAGAHLGLPMAQAAPSAGGHLSSNRHNTQADSGLPLASLVSDRALRQTLGRPTSQCGKSGNCRFRLIRGSLYRSRSCNPRRPNWQLLSGLLVSAVARAESAAGTPMPDVEVCMHQGASPLRGSEGPVLQWCSRSRELLGFPSPYEADCVYKHRYVFTLEHYRRLSRDEHPRPSFAQRIPLAVWRGTCTGVASTWRADNLHNVPRAKLVIPSRGAITIA
ncbi:hypothetical protein AB1Y20_000347 [Prymnesium parvum]|uniref:Uncharacterized protein n=1 Tax=Prymnesium parvum TaxID=97485 RepID=A0AB34K8A6_PRYPA